MSSPFSFTPFPRFMPNSFHHILRSYIFLLPLYLFLPKIIKIKQLLRNWNWSGLFFTRIDCLVRSRFRCLWEGSKISGDIIVLRWIFCYLRSLLGVMVPVLPLICFVTLGNFKYRKTNATKNCEKDSSEEIKWGAEIE